MVLKPKESQAVVLQRTDSRMRHVLGAFILCIFLLDAAPSDAQQQNATEQTPSAGAAADLQKATQNPVASLISVPIQNNSNFGIGPFRGDP